MVAALTTITEVAVEEIIRGITEVDTKGITGVDTKVITGADTKVITGVDTKAEEVTINRMKVS